MKKTVTRFMKILFTDEVAAKFSWTGQKENKQRFEILLLWKIIFGKNRFKIYLNLTFYSKLRLYL